MKIFRAHTLLFIVALITIFHFIFTSLVRYYIAIQVGLQTGHVVAEGLIEATEIPKFLEPEKDVNEIYQNMKNKSNEILSKWKIPLLLISLPVKPVIQPFLNKIRKAWIYDPVISKKISKKQFKTRAIIIENIANGLNSLIFGLLIYLALKLFLEIRLRSTSKSTR